MFTQSCPTLCYPMDCNPPGSSVHELFQARILEWLPFLFPGDLPDPVIKPGSPSIAGRVFIFWGTFLMKQNIELFIWSSSPTPGHMSKKKVKTLIWKDTCIPIFIAALFTITKLSIKVLLNVNIIGSLLLFNELILFLAHINKSSLGISLFFKIITYSWKIFLPRPCNWQTVLLKGLSI